MTRFNGPDSVEGDSFRGKFVRAGSVVVFGPNGDFDKNHDDIARDDGILDQLSDLLGEERDAGQIFIFKDNPKWVDIEMGSMRLRLPDHELARERTREVIASVCPGYKVEVGQAHVYGSPERR